MTFAKRSRLRFFRLVTFQSAIQRFVFDGTRSGRFRRASSSPDLADSLGGRQQNGLSYYRSIEGASDTVKSVGMNSTPAGLVNAGHWRLRRPWMPSCETRPAHPANFQFGFLRERPDTLPSAYVCNELLETRPHPTASATLVRGLARSCRGKVASGGVPKTVPAPVWNGNEFVASVPSE